MGNLLSILGYVQKYIGPVIVGVIAASHTGATNAEKRSVVVQIATGVDAAAAATDDPTIKAVGQMVDIAASVFNALTKLVSHPAAATPAA